MIIICACVKIQAQINYVRNASFEQSRSCPVNADQIQLAKYWTSIDTVNVIVTPNGDTLGSPYCSADYINTCAVGNYFSGAPKNSWFYQYPRTGNGMVQATMFFDESFSASYKRDYLLGRLYKHLIAGKHYCITFYVSFSGTTSSIPCMYAVDHIGAYIDNGAIGDTGINSCGLPKPWIIPQVYTTTIITDTVNWIKVQGDFVANGTEKFITIGNFFDKASTNYITYPVSGGIPFAYYLIDDVSVIESTEVAHAGIDKGVAYGDSVRIGTNEEGMPCTWYVAGDTTPVGYSGGIWVKPTTTTSYVVEMDLCGNVTRDTVKVTVWPVGTPFDKLRMTEPVIWPNPASNELHVSGGAGSILSVYDVVGKEVYKQVITSDNEVINTEPFPKGIYLIHVTEPSTGRRFVKKIIKE